MCVNKVSILFVWFWRVEVEVFGVFLVSLCGREFGENIAWVCCCFYSPDLHFAVQVILANFMVTRVDSSTMFVQVWSCCQMFCCLVISKKIIVVMKRQAACSRDKAIYSPAHADVMMRRSVRP